MDYGWSWRNSYFSRNDCSFNPLCIRLTNHFFRYFLINPGTFAITTSATPTGTGSIVLATSPTVSDITVSGTYIQNTTSNEPFEIINATQVVGTTFRMYFGQSKTSGNCGSIAFFYNGAGSGNNYVAFGQYGSERFLVYPGTNIGTVPSFGSALINQLRLNTLEAATNIQIKNGANTTTITTAASSSYNFPLPATAGSAGNLLTSQAGSAMTWTGTTGTGTVVLSTSPTLTGPVTITRTTGSHLNIVATNANASSYMNFNNSNTGGTALFGVDGGSYAGFSNGATLFGSWTNHPVIIATNATQRMRITATGDVGINTTTPSERLEVNGNIRSGLVKRTPSAATFELTALSAFPNTTVTTVTGWVQQSTSGENLTVVGTSDFSNQLGRTIAVTISYNCARNSNGFGKTEFWIKYNSKNYAWNWGPALDWQTGTFTLILPNNDTFWIEGYQDSGSGSDVAIGSKLSYVIH